MAVKLQHPKILRRRNTGMVKPEEKRKDMVVVLKAPWMENGFEQAASRFNFSKVQSSLVPCMNIRVSIFFYNERTSLSQRRMVKTRTCVLISSKKSFHKVLMFWPGVGVARARCQLVIYHIKYIMTGMRGARHGWSIAANGESYGIPTNHRSSHTQCTGPCTVRSFNTYEYYLAFFASKVCGVATNR